MDGLSVISALLLLGTYFLVYLVVNQDIGFRFDFVNRKVTPCVIALVATITTIYHWNSKVTCTSASNKQRDTCYRSPLYSINASDFQRMLGMKYTDLPSISYYPYVPLWILLHMIPAVAPYFLWKLLIRCYDKSLWRRFHELGDKKVKASEKIITSFAEDFHIWMTKGRSVLLPAFLFVRGFQTGCNWLQIVILHYCFALPVGWEIDKLLDVLHWTEERTIRSFPSTVLCRYTYFSFDSYIPGRFWCELDNNSVFGNICFFLIGYFWTIAIASTAHFIGSIFFWCIRYTRDGWVRMIWKLTSYYTITKEDATEKFMNYLGGDGALLIHLIEARCKPTVVTKILEISYLNNEIKEDP